MMQKYNQLMVSLVTNVDNVMEDYAYHVEGKMSVCNRLLAFIDMYGEAYPHKYTQPGYINNMPYSKAIKACEDYLKSSDSDLKKKCKACFSTPNGSVKQVHYIMGSDDESEN